MQPNSQPISSVKLTAIALAVTACCHYFSVINSAHAAIPAAHVYHNHMPNFWPFYGVDVGNTYNATATGQPVQYTYVTWNGSSAVWESNQASSSGNRELSLPANCSSVIDKNDGSFKP